MKHLLAILFLFQVCTCFQSYAQRINIRTYSIEDGLINNDVLNVREDSRGFIWLCTRGGLSRFDGLRFTNYGIPDGLTNDMINDIAEIAPQKFIVAQNLDGPRLLENDSIYPLSNSNITVNRFYRDGGQLLVVTDYHGMMRWEQNNFHPVNNTRTENIDGFSRFNDSLWAIVQYHTSIQLVTHQLQPYSSSSIIGATSVYTDSKHRTWLGTATGLKLLAPVQAHKKPIEFIPLPPEFDLPVFRNTWISGFLEDSQGNYWIATTGGGLVRVYANGKSTVYTEADGLPASFINCIWEDSQKNIWIGTPLGLAKFSIANEVKVFNSKHGMSTAGPVCILPMQANHVRIFNQQNSTDLDLQTGNFTPVSTNNSNSILYKISKDEVLQVSKKETLLYRSHQPNAQQIVWPAVHLETIARVDSNTFAGATLNKLFVVSGGKVKGTLTLPRHLLIYAIEPDKSGTLWLAMVDSGLYKVKWQRERDTVLLTVTDSIIAGLPDRHVRSLLHDRDNELWIGTRYKGAVRLSEYDFGKRNMEYYNINNGLSSDFVRTISRDAKGNIWIGTSQGIDKLIHHDDGYRVFNFGKINGIYHTAQHISFVENEYLLTEGQVLVHARDLHQDTLAPPHIYITKVAVGAMVHKGISIPNSRTTVSYRQPQVYFEFCAPQFASEKWNEYQYRLLGGSDANWIKATSSRNVYFANLQPGDYTFEVRVLGLNGRWGVPAKYDFTVTTPFWRTGWFVALIVMLVAAMVYWLYRYRIQQLIRLQQVRNQIAADLHDEIGSNLTNISILSSLGKRNIAHPQQATVFLQRISEEVASSSQSLDDIIWSVNAGHDTLEETVARMRLYATELFEGAGIRYELRFDPTFESTKLVMEQRRDVYMIYKEAVNNILKHARAKQVRIEIAIENQQLVLHIKDDGIGFEPGQSPHRHGLDSIKARVKRWGGKIKFDSMANKGTSVYVTLPLAT